MVFRGNFPAKLDTQGRIKVPTAHRRVFEETYSSEVYVTSITGENVLIYPMQEWEKLEQKMLDGSKFSRAKRVFLRNTSFYGQAGTMDRQGRVLIQPHLREKADIRGELAVMGSLNSLELWNGERIRERMDNDPVGEEEMAALAELGI